jgi:predicted TIM-barrel fold metal-dependent hydrolase
MPAVNDSHCHYFSTPFFAALGGDAALAKLGWDPPGSAEALADRWAAELDRHGVGRAALIASIPGDTASVRAAVGRHPDRFIGFFMVNPMQPDAIAASAAALEDGFLRAICLFPSMHRYQLHDAHVIRTFEIAAARPGSAVFVHCGVLSVGVRRKLGLPSAFDLRCGNPAALQGVASQFPDVPVIVPHFGAGFFREALMAADMCANIHFDTSSSNAWIKYHPGLTLDGVFRQALAVVGPERLLFGSDSSFFPRGWAKDVYEQQSAVLGELAVSSEVREKILGGNFARLFPRHDHKG